MIIRSKAPLRLGLAGGGTDLSPYCDEYGGCTLNATINMFVYCTIETHKEAYITFYASDIGDKLTVPLSDIDSLKEIPSDVKLHVAVYKRVIKDFNHGIPLSFNITTYSQAAMGSGLGGSSALVVVILKAFVEWLRLPLGEYDIARLAWEIERIDLGLAGGKQDQYATTFGGFNFMEFYDQNKVIVNPLRIKKWIYSELEDSLILYFIGKSRESANIIKQQIDAVKDDGKKLEAMHRLKDVAYKMKEAILMGNFDLFRESLKEGWKAKKATADVISNPKIEKVYEKVMNEGGYAGKLSGAGGGGFFMFYVNPAERSRICNLLKGMGGETYITQFCLEGTRGWTI